jgi:membrane fusion protein (multidrug efflux system)
VYLVEEQKEDPNAKDPDGKPARPAPPPKGADGKPTLIARQQFVRLGERRGDFVAVLNGLKGDETVVSNGAFKLRNNQTIMINNALAPPAQIVPAPVDR